MKQIHKTIRYILFAICILVPFATPLTVHAEELSITVTFFDADAEVLHWDFPYSDEYFETSSDSFDRELAKASLGLALSAFRNDGMNRRNASVEKPTLENQYLTYLSAAGFENIKSFGYDEETSAQSLSGVIASKRIGNFTLIAAVPAGQGYQNEWSGNLTVGSGERHEGFDYAAQVFENQIRNYIDENQIEGDMKLWLSGFSRASAVSNLTAADLIEENIFQDVYAYLYAVPRTTRAPKALSGIYNICGKYDFVTMIPLQSWGYERYGTDLYTPAQEMDSDYGRLAVSASEVNYAVKEEFFRNNPDLNYQIQLILAALAEIFPDAEDYEREMQDVVLRYWKNPTLSNIVPIANSVLSSVQGLDRKEEFSSKVLNQYIYHVVSDYLRGNKQQIADGSWNANASLNENLALEHLPVVYLSWLYSQSEEEEVLFGNDRTRRMIVNGDVDVSVYQGDSLISEITHDGDLKHSFDEDSTLPIIFMQRKGNITVLNFPVDEEYQLLIHVNRDDYVSYYDTIFHAGDLKGDTDTIWLNLVSEGDYLLEVAADESALSGMTAVTGNIESQLETDFDYSAVTLMSMEESGERLLTLDQLLNILYGLCVLLVAMGVVCLLATLFHRIKARRGIKREYSLLWIIIPHTILIIIFAMLTEFLTLNFYVIGRLKSGSATMTIILILLLTLRGSLRNRKRSNWIYTGILFVLAALTWFLYERSCFGEYSTSGAVLYGLVTAALTVRGIIGYRRGKISFI